MTEDYDILLVIHGDPTKEDIEECKKKTLENTGLKLKVVVKPIE